MLNPTASRLDKSTNGRVDLGILLRRLRRLAATVLPERAARRSASVMLTPRRRPDAYASDLLRSDTADRVPYGNRWLRVWRFGEGPAVLLVHGWAGAAAQFDPWIEPLVGAGYRVVAFDAPAHGGSGGHSTNIMDVAGAVQLVGGLAGPLRAIVAHSFGAPASLMALRHGLVAERLVLLAPPLSLGEHSAAVARALGLPMLVRSRMQRRMESRLGFLWQETDSDRALDALDRKRAQPTLLIHDRHDREVPFASSERIAAAVPSARLVATDGLGHARILRNARVIGEALAFIGEAQTTAVKHAA